MKSYSPFCFCSRRNEVHDSDHEFYVHEDQLNRNLTHHNIQRLNVKGDGNCLFYALAEGLMYEMEMDPNRFGAHLASYGLSSDFRLNVFANCLRQICIHEWKFNEKFYSQFVNTHKISFHTEVKKFSKSGVSDSILGDVVPLTISNVLKVKITIFTSVSNLSRIDIKPDNVNSCSSTPLKTIYLAYNQYGIGHYDAAYPRN